MYHLIEPMSGTLVYLRLSADLAYCSRPGIDFSRFGKLRRLWVNDQAVFLMGGETSGGEESRRRYVLRKRARKG
jgi:hypothetical protein